ncbi:MAG: flavodoxin domain-containing protein [Rudaea sp.]
MQKKVLVAYATNSGSTAEVADAVGEELRKCGMVADVCRLTLVPSVEAYSAVVVAAPMILGWHGEAGSFIKKHQQALSKMPVAYLFTAMSLTRPRDAKLNGVPVLVDPNLAHDPKNPSRPGLRDRYATVGRYLGPALRAAPSVRPVSVGFFAGKLDFGRLKLPQLLFVMLIIQAKPGDRRNWKAIRGWAASLSTSFAGPA